MLQRRLRGFQEDSAGLSGAFQCVSGVRGRFREVSDGLKEFQAVPGGCSAGFR